MKKGAIIIALTWVMIAGCEPNEISFYVEHVKQQPESPECAVTESDGFIASGTLDLAFRNPYSGWYLVTNQLMAREDYGNAIAESNGIIVEGMEAYVISLDGARLSNTSYYQFETYVEPEDSSIAAGIMIPYETVAALADEYGCSDIDDAGEYFEAIWQQQGYVNITEEIVETVFPEVSVFTYAVSRFLGHSSGGKELLTPEFSFPIHICCGCLIDWSGCAGNCSTFCEEPEPHSMCAPGVENGGDPLDCRSLFYNPDAAWVPPPWESCLDTSLCSCQNDCEETAT